MNNHSYLFHGHKITVSGEESILAALQRRLGLFPLANSEGPPLLQFSFRQVTDPAYYDDSQLPSGPKRTVYDSEQERALYVETTGQFCIDVPRRARVICETQTGDVQIAYPQSAARDINLLSHLCFTVPLAELLKRQGLYMLHAAGLCLDGKGLLVAGASGAGKTTLAITLLRAGFGFLGDDTTFLSPSPQGLHALAFPDEIDVTDDTAGYFPELRGLARNPPLPRGPKHSVDFVRLYEATPTWRCVPSVLVFPRAVSAHMNVLSPMSKDEALIELLCNVLRTDLRAAQAHLDALAALVKQCRCFRLHASRDFEALPTLFRNVLNQDPRQHETSPLHAPPKQRRE